MRIFTTLPQEDLRKVGPAAQRIEADGYTGVSTQENRHDPFLSLAVAGVATRKIELHTGVAISFPRSPMVAANIGWDLAASTGGRFTLGLGSQIRPHNERRFSVPWSALAPCMREYIQAVRAIWLAWKGDGKLACEGQTLPLHADDSQFRARGLRRAGAAHRACGGGVGDAQGRGRGGGRRQAPRLLHRLVVGLPKKRRLCTESGVTQPWPSRFAMTTPCNPVGRRYVWRASTRSGRPLRASASPLCRGQAFVSRWGRDYALS